MIKGQGNGGKIAMMRAEPGTTIGHYAIVKSLGQGSMGAVYEATDLDSGQHVAIKLLRTEYASSESLLARFEREIMILRLLDHPNIVSLLDFGIHENKTYFVMSLVRGITLTTWMRSHFFCPLEVLSVLEPLCSALDHAHARNVLHRDVKPGNVLIDVTQDNPGIFLSDFGLSKVIGMISLTQTQTQIGTPNYMSPEQVEDLPLTPATDVYALAVITYEMLLHKLPFDAQSDLEMTLAHVEKAPQPPSEIAPNFPSALESVLLRGLVKDSSDRYSSAGLFYQELAEAVAMLSADEQETVFRYE